nr:acetylcholinesterase 8 [Pardosa pseudoannulata]
MYIFIFTIYLMRIASSELIVQTRSGPIRSVPSSVDDVEAFLGIPYAEPPVRELRFAKPIPKRPWKEVYNASSLPPPCPQYSLGPYYFMPDITNMTEDCLYLNIWVPKAETTDRLRPVMIYIHHGGCSSGSSNFPQHDGSQLVSRGNVIFATMNYRLGIFGFFLGYTEEANGSMGMYDQLMAINWVKDNAERFGGDPENIILMGVSAGGWSVSAHMISPLSKNLFKKAIIHSGSIVHPMFIADNEKLFQNSEMVASFVGCTNESLTLGKDPRSVVKCLKEKPIEDLIAAEKALLKRSFFNFFPRVNDEFLPKESIALLREGKFRKDIDVMIGIDKDEGGLFMLLAVPEYFGRYGSNDVSLRKGSATALMQTASLALTGSYNSELVDFYMSRVKSRTPEGYAQMISNILGDHIITCSTVFFAEILSFKGNNVYFYKFEFRSPSTPAAKWLGVMHLDELQYVFGVPFHDNFTTEEKELSNLLIDRWTTFAKKGNPNIPGHIPWLRYSYHQPLYLSFGQEEESIRIKPTDRCEFWRKAFKSDFDPDVIRFLRNSGMNITDNVTL